MKDFVIKMQCIPLISFQKKQVIITTRFFHLRIRAETPAFRRGEEARPPFFNSLSLFRAVNAPFLFTSKGQAAIKRTVIASIVSQRSFA